MFECDHCDKKFETEPARRGHMAFHTKYKRSKGRDKKLYRHKHFIQLTKNPTVGPKLPPSYCSRFNPPHGLYRSVATNPNDVQNEQHLRKLREWVASQDSPFNEDLAIIPDDKHVSPDIVNEYLRILENTCDGVYYLPDDFDDEKYNVDGDIRFIAEKKDLKMLLVHINISCIKPDVRHSYLGAVDFVEKLITFIDTGNGLKKL